MGSQLLPEQVKSLAELPPLPVMRAQLLGVIQAPATQLVRTLANPPARWLAFSRLILKRKQLRLPEPVITGYRSRQTTIVFRF